MTELPLAPLKRLMKQAGAERVADDGVEAMRDVIEEEIEDLAQDATQFAQHAGRKTVKKEDVMAAK
jgi:histone H3/H4